VSPAIAHAGGLVDLSWTGCNAGSPVEQFSAAEHVLTMSVTGVEGNYDGFEIVLAVNDHCTFYPGDVFPDAWRFDAAGCQSGSFAVTRPRSLGACPGLFPVGVSYTAASFGTVDYYFGPGPPGQLRTMFLHIATSVPMQHFDPGTRYVLAQLHFDMTNAVATYDPSGKLCGCGSSKEEIYLLSGHFTPFADVSNVLSSENNAYWNEYFYCTIGSPSVAASASAPVCLPVPAQAATWGQIRASYR